MAGNTWDIKWAFELKMCVFMMEESKYGFLEGNNMCRQKALSVKNAWKMGSITSAYNELLCFYHKQACKQPPS